MMSKQLPYQLYDIPDQEGYYSITPLGEVYSHPNKTHSGKWLARYVDKRSGYIIVHMARTTRYVHRLVAETFIPNPMNKKEVNHMNGNKTDYRIENLEWVTPKENVAHAHKTGLITILRGSIVSNSDLVEEDVSDIKMFIRAKLPRRRIAGVYHISRQTVDNIAIGRTWGHVS